jgi:hypothetical protein
MLTVDKNETLRLKKTGDCFCKRNPMFANVLTFLGLIPFELHLGSLPYRYIFYHIIFPTLYPYSAMPGVERLRPVGE